MANGIKRGWLRFNPVIGKLVQAGSNGKSASRPGRLAHRAFYVLAVMVFGTGFEPTASADHALLEDALPAAWLQPASELVAGDLSFLQAGPAADTLQTTSQFSAFNVTDSAELLALKAGTNNGESGCFVCTGYGDGDMYPDCDFNGLDVTWFAIALRDPDFYALERGVEAVVHGDLDGNQRLDFDDVDDFSSLIRCEIPEPSSLVLIGLGGLMFAVAGVKCKRPTENGRRVSSRLNNEGLRR
jgi:hypothetical protein